MDGEFFPELVPDTDLQVLAWLGDDRDSIILAVNRSITAEDERDIRKKLGDVGEQVVVSALRCAGYVPRHVALIQTFMDTISNIKEADYWKELR